MWFKVIFFTGFLSLFTVDCACPENFTSVPGDDGCYFWFTGDYNYQDKWQEARERCQSIGSDLAIIKDCEQFKALSRYISISAGLEIPPRFSFWIGGTDAGDEGNWHWIDGTPMALGAPYWGSDFGVQQPSGGEIENCANMHKPDRYYFHDGDCNKGGYAFCQADPI